MHGSASAGDPRPRRFVASARTNLPDWPTEPPAPDLTGRGFVALGFGAAAEPVIAAWADIVRAAGFPLMATCFAESGEPSPARPWLDEALRSAVTGWRLMLAGPSHDILQAAAQAREAGLIDSEIRAFAMGGPLAQLQCVHCKAIFGAAAGPGAQVACPHCDRLLLVHQHLSRRLAALVAFAADAEARP